MSQQALNSYRWDGTHWAVATHSNLPPVTWDPSSSVRLATLNILADCFPWFIEMAIRSSERYEWLCRGLALLDPSIIGMNEVTPNALRQLQECPFVRENYFITENYDSDQGRLSPHGCLILSKLPLLEVFGVTVTDSRRLAVVFKVQLSSASNGCVYICSHHTTAYQTPKNAQLRAQQIRDIVQVLEPLSLSYVILGDLNLHYEFEDNVVLEHRFVDAWAQTHFSDQSPFNDGDPGFTFDAIRNTFIPYYIPGEHRQMRLDRILFSRGFPFDALSPCSLWATEPIRSDSYVFPSDHFGLFIDLVPTEDRERSTMCLSELDLSAAAILSVNAQKNKNIQAYRLGWVRRILSLTSHALWLGSVAVGLR